MVALDQVGSTNDEAMALLRAGDPGGVFVSAKAQTGGRGRQGRAWQSPPGNLYASLALRDPAPVARAPQLGFVAGVALARVLRGRVSDNRRLTLKWPNDALFGGAKLAGILLESAQLGAGALGCVVGVGVNCRWAPSDLPYAATTLAEAGDPAPDPARVLDEFAEAFAEEFADWREGGFASTRQRWLGYAGVLGHKLDVRTSTASMHGLFDGIDEAGRLRLATVNGLRLIDAGDVFFSTSGAAPSLPHMVEAASPERQS